MKKVVPGKGTHRSETNILAACHEALMLWEMEIGTFHVFELPADRRRDGGVEVGGGQAELQKGDSVEVIQARKMRPVLRPQISSTPIMPVFQLPRFSASLH